jgi:transposase
MNTFRTPYPSDLTDEQWDRIGELLPSRADTRTRSLHSEREILCAINYRWSTGCVWRMLPHDFPPWKTVHRYFRAWRRRGLLGPIRQVLLGDAGRTGLRDDPSNRSDFSGNLGESSHPPRREAG